MIRPASFGFNAETASSNVFQGSVPMNEHQVQVKAVEEFDHFVDILRAHNIDVLVIEDTPYPVKPDAVFPNNWVSFQRDGSVILYPMQAKSRRAERRPEIIEALGREFRIDDVIDLTGYEKSDRFLEGTGNAP